MLCMAIGRSVGTAAVATNCSSRAPEHQGSTTSRVPLAPDHQPGAPVHVTGRCDLAGLWDYHTSGHSTWNQEDSRTSHQQCNQCHWCHDSAEVYRVSQKGWQQKWLRGSKMVHNCFWGPKCKKKKTVRPKTFASQDFFQDFFWDSIGSSSNRAPDHWRSMGVSAGRMSWGTWR